MTEKQDNDIITFSFTGGIAENHELSFYEAARFQYAAAKLLYKLEHFRQKGIVLDRVSRKIDADIRVSTAKEGDLPLILVPVSELVSGRGLCSPSRRAVA